MTVPPPLALNAELTHRCPMRCLYCSNPLALAPASAELPTAAWIRIFEEAAELGVLQLHLSGGEPTARADLARLVAAAAGAGLYTNLITSGVLLDAATVGRLAEAGLDHVQISIQDTDIGAGERIGGLAGAHDKKLAAAALVRRAGMALTLNAVVHRGNIGRVPEMIALALDLGAGRLEIAHVQYYGWALVNRAALLPGRTEVDLAAATVAAARRRLAGRLVIDYVPPDYHARLPKPCMGGWGRQFLVIDPAGWALPCHAAATIPGMTFANAAATPLARIWGDDAAFNRFRGTGWMPEPCAGCERREIDWGGCRCQALALAGDAAATDPVCHKSPRHDLVAGLAAAAGGSGEAEVGTPGGPPASRIRYRRIGRPVQRPTEAGARAGKRTT